jgi:hypothetical protein
MSDQLAQQESLDLQEASARLVQLERKAIREPGELSRIGEVFGLHKIKLLRIQLLLMQLHLIILILAIME